MAENKMSEMIKTSLEGIREFADMDTIIGNVINTPSGVSVIPVSKVTIGYASGGLDFGGKKLTPLQNFGGGGGTGISITPVAFLTVNPSGEINLISVSNEPSGFERLASVIERSPEIIERIKNSIT